MLCEHRRHDTEKKSGLLARGCCCLHAPRRRPPRSPPRVCPAAGRSERPEPADRAPLFPGTLTGNAGERGSRSQPASPPCNPKSAVWGYIPNVPCEGGLLGNFSLPALDHNQLFRDGQGRAGAPPRHRRVSPGRGHSHPGQPPKLSLSVPGTLCLRGTAGACQANGASPSAWGPGCMAEGAWEGAKRHPRFPAHTDSTAGVAAPGWTMPVMPRRWGSQGSGLG